MHIFSLWELQHIRQPKISYEHDFHNKFQLNLQIVPAWFVLPISTKGAFARAWIGID
jgi:hypothetical protein